MTSGHNQPEAEIIPPGEEPSFRGGSDNGGSGDVFSDPMTMPRITYTLYAIACVSGFPMLIGLIVAYVARGEAPDWLKGHYTFLIGTFWIGLLLIIVGALTVIFGIGLFLLWLLPLWYIIRVVRGWMLLENRKPVPNPSSALFG